MELDKKNVLSIFKNGLRKPGSVVDGKKIEELRGHFERGFEYDEVENWSEAVFLSPAISYASLYSYADRFASPLDENDEMCIVIEAAVRPGKFTKHKSTISHYELPPSTDENVEFRCESGDPEQYIKSSSGDVVRIPSTGNIIVVAVTLLSKNFISNKKSNREKPS